MFKIVRLLALISALLVGSWPVQHAVAQSDRLVAAYVDGDTLYSWREGESGNTRLATGMDNFTQVRLSLNATEVAYQTGGALWAIRVDGAQGIQPVVDLDALNAGKAHVRFVLDFGWLDEKSIVFNTYLVNQGGPNRQGFADDLWIADISTGKITRWFEDGAGGAFTISPDGRQIALARPGDYATQTAGKISLAEVSTQTRRDLLTFPFVNTASSSDFYPKLAWTPDSKRLYVGIPDPDLVYATTNPPKTRLYELLADGKPSQIGEVAADFFGPPEFSPDGTSILYARRVGSAQDNLIAVYQARRDGTSEHEIRRGKIGTLEPAHWSPMGKVTFVEGGAGQLWIGGAGVERKRFPTASDLVFDPIWADNRTLVYATSLGGAGELRYYVNGSSTDPVTMVKRSTGGSFDARRH